MGTNRRYADHYDRLMDKRIAESAARPQPQSLSRAEVSPETDPVHRPPKGIPVTAWVRYPDSPRRVRGQAVAWTKRAVQIEFEDGDNNTQICWVWASAVQRS